jgi:hypothetical protein
MIDKPVTVSAETVVNIASFQVNDRVAPEMGNINKKVPSKTSNTKPSTKRNGIGMLLGFGWNSRNEILFIQKASQSKRSMLSMALFEPMMTI